MWIIRGNVDNTNTVDNTNQETEKQSEKRRLYHKFTITSSLATDTKLAITSRRRMMGWDEAVQRSSTRWPNKERWMELAAFCNFEIQEIEVLTCWHCMT